MQKKNLTNNNITNVHQMNNHKSLFELLPYVLNKMFKISRRMIITVAIRKEIKSRLQNETERKTSEHLNFFNTLTFNMISLLFPALLLFCYRFPLRCCLSSI